MLQNYGPFYLNLMRTIEKEGKLADSQDNGSGDAAVILLVKGD
jgi:hypothetical protein